MLRRFPFAVIATTVVAFAIAAQPPARQSTARWTSLVRIIVDPARFEGVAVEVTGYLDPIGTLFLTKDHAEVRDLSSGVRIVDPTSDGKVIRGCTGTYVEVVGTLRLEQGRPQGDDITFYELAELRLVRTISSADGATCWKAAASSSN